MEIKPEIIHKVQINNQYLIYIKEQIIGEINYIIEDNILIIGWLNIYEEFQNNKYGYQVVESLLKNNNIKCIIGQSLKESRTFWNKCIKKYKGCRKNITYSNACSSSFIIPKIKIDNFEFYLEISNNL